MKMITPIQDLTARLLAADLDPDLASSHKRGYQAHTTLSVPHRTRSAGRGRNPLHRLVYAIDADDAIEVSTRRWVPRLNETSLLIEDELYTVASDHAIKFITEWANNVINTETVEPTQEPLSDDDGTLDDTPTPSPGSESLNYAAPNVSVEPREQRIAAPGDHVYVVHTPAEHPDIPAGTPAIVVDESEECEPINDGRILLELDSILFDLDPFRRIAPHDLVFADAPSVEVLATP